MPSETRNRGCWLGASDSRYESASYHTRSACIRCLFTRYFRRAKSRVADPLHQKSDDSFASDARLGLMKTYGGSEARVAPEKKHWHVLKQALRCIYSFIRLR